MTYPNLHFKCNGVTRTLFKKCIIWCMEGNMVHGGEYGAWRGIWCMEGNMVHGEEYGAWRGIS